MKQFCMKIDLISQGRENVLFLPSNMAAMTSYESALLDERGSLFKLVPIHPVRADEELGRALGRGVTSSKRTTTTTTTKTGVGMRRIVRLALNCKPVILFLDDQNIFRRMAGLQDETKTQTENKGQQKENHGNDCHQSHGTYTAAAAVDCGLTCWRKDTF